MERAAVADFGAGREELELHVVAYATWQRSVSVMMISLTAAAADADFPPGRRRTGERTGQRQQRVPRTQRPPRKYGRARHG